MSDGSAPESWSSLPHWEGFYAVSDLGRVRSLARQIVRSDGRVLNLREKFLKHGVGPQGYHSVGLSRACENYLMKVHRLVLLSFVGPCPDGMEGCHNDGDTSNNCLYNLRWDYHTNNMFDAIAHGTHYSSSRTSCPRGHLLEPPNLVVHSVRKGRARNCLACTRTHTASYYRRDHGLQLFDFVEESDRQYALIMQLVA